MEIKTLHSIKSKYGTALYWAVDEDDAYDMWYNDRYSPDTSDILVEQVLTDQGYPITKLKYITKGDYFHRVNKCCDGEYCELSTVWCRSG